MENPFEIARGVAGEIQAVFGSDLVSVILYGSAAGESYIPGKSDVNLLVVLSEEGIKRLDLFYPIIKRFPKKSVSIPLCITENFVETSLDTFPVEFLNMKIQHTLLYGEDVLEKIKIEKKWVRAQCERELKGKLLHLRQGFIETGGKLKALKFLIARSLKTFLFLFNALIYLHDRTVPLHRSEKIEVLEELFKIDKGLFNQLIDIYESKAKKDPVELRDLVVAYIDEIRNLSNQVDQLKCEG